MAPPVIQEVRVAWREGFPDPQGENLRAEMVRSLGIEGVARIRTAKVYRFEGITEGEADYLARALLCEDIYQEYTLNRPLIVDADWLVEVAYKPGVMNPEAASLVKAARDLGITGLVAADSSHEYAFYGMLSFEERRLVLDRLLVNPTVQRVVTARPATLVIEGEPGPVEIIPLREMTDDELLALSRDRLFLDLEELKTIQRYFRRLGRDPTDCEIEVLAQTWSEHCVHKTFKARLEVNGQPKVPLLERIRRASEEAAHPLVLSAFEDNSGVIEFYEGWAVCGKVETHNAPSAIEPYGGAATGSGGVFRDVMGTGQGARVIASTDMFCFAPPDLPWEEVPPGCLHPVYLLRRVVAGVRDYGNRMGVPTNNGSVHFHRDFRAKPTVIVGAYGLLPAKKAIRGRPKPKDLAVVVGGRTGRDGLHGATFSSAHMTASTIEVHAQAVQIGHPIEEKRTSDALLAARDEGLIRAITDCGAGGFSSAAGEMGADVGVHLYLDRVPLKYTGLAPWEILLSESQERMLVAVAPENAARLVEICRAHNVEATVIGEFTGNKRFTASYGSRTVLDLDMGFLHQGRPRRTCKARWEPEEVPEDPIPPLEDLPSVLRAVMGHWNVCSKEPIVRMYDHGVQGALALPPFGGVTHGGPNDAVVLTPLLGRPYGLVIAHGLNPILMRLDPYAGALWACAEAVSNAVAAGADAAELVLIDNFIWPVPDERYLGALDLAVDACVDFVRATGMPFVSGKDSLSSTYLGPDGTRIDIPPVLCISAFGRIPDVARTVSADLKGPGHLLVLVGWRRPPEMAGSVYLELHGASSRQVPRVDPLRLVQVWRAVHRAIRAGAVLAAHDVSHGGPAAAVAEMCLGGALGAEVVVPDGEDAGPYLFNETAGNFVLELAPGADPAVLFGGVPWRVLGHTVDGPVLTFRLGERRERVPLADLEAAWRRPMREVFGP